jgi:hypothetical protein
VRGYETISSQDIIPAFYRVIKYAHADKAELAIKKNSKSF